MYRSHTNVSKLDADLDKIKVNCDRLLKAIPKDNYQYTEEIEISPKFSVKFKNRKHTSGKMQSYMSYDEATFKKNCMVSGIPDENNSQASEHGLYRNLKAILTGWVSGQAAKRRRSSTASVEKEATIYPYHLNGELPEYFVKKAERELGETPEVRQRCLQELRDIIRESQSSHHTDDATLLMFLRCKKFDVRRAFKMMENFNIYKHTHNDLYPYSDADGQMELDHQMFYILPYRDPEGRGILVFKAGQIEPGRMPIMESLTLTISVFLKILEEPANQIAGLVVIADLADISMKWMGFFSLTYARAIRFLYLECMPCRYKNVFFLNENFLFRFAYQLFEKLLPKKFRSRIHVYGSDAKSLRKHFPVHILPDEFCGNLENWKRRYTLEEFENPLLLRPIEDLPID